MDWLEFFVRLGVAICLGAAIGLERQISHHMAGLKTNALVSTGSCLFMVMAASFSGESNSRVAAQIITGIGFLGGGVILRDGFHVRGLNTAATLWCASAVGTLAGLGLTSQAAVGTTAVLLINIGLRPVSEKLGEQGLAGFGPDAAYQVRMTCLPKNEASVRDQLLGLTKKANMNLKALKIESVGSDTIVLQAELVSASRNGTRLEQLVSTIEGFKDVTAVEWKAIV